MKEGQSQPTWGKTASPGHVAALVAAAHELKSPLTLINHIVHTLKDVESGLNAAERAQYLDRLELTSQRLLRLVQQLTISYRLTEANQLSFNLALEPLSITEVCETALHEMSFYARQYNQRLCLQASRCPHLVLANRDILHGIVVNLVDNALRHNTPGSAVYIQPRCRGEQVRLNVHDDGLPVSLHEIRRLRHTIGRQPQPLSSRSGTSGLGLYIVGQLATAMGGTLGLGRSVKGTTFFVDLLRSHQLNLL